MVRQELQEPMAELPTFIPSIQMTGGRPLQGMLEKILGTI